MRASTGFTLDRREFLKAAALLTAVLSADSPLLAAGGEGSRTVTLSSLLEEMIDRDALARWPDPSYVCKEFTSYDRRSVAPNLPGWWANEDHNNYLRTEMNNGRTEYVMMDADGPGAIVCFFKASTDPNATVRIYLDGAAEPTIEENMRYFLGGGTETEQEKNFPEPRVPPYPADESTFLGGYGTVKYPLASVLSLGCDFFLPIPYATHCKVTYDKPHPPNCYYRIVYRIYEPGTDVETFTLPSLKKNAQLISSVGQTLLHPDAQLGDQVMAGPVTETIDPGGSYVALHMGGPAALRKFTIKIDAADIPAALRATVLCISFDSEPTVWCPVGDFFASGIGIHSSHCWDKAVETDGSMTSYWVMPFKNGCKIELVNYGSIPVQATFSNCLVTKWNWDDRCMYFHTGWRQEYPIQTVRADGTMDWNYIQVSGKGVYVGDTLIMHNGSSGWWGEGDEKVWVDDDTFPSHFGTGSEDYYGYSRGGTPSERFEAPFNDHPQIEGDKQIGYSSLTRVRSLDAIPFTKKLDFNLEIWHWDATVVAYAAATYWYGMPGATSNRVPMPEEAIRPLLEDSNMTAP